MDRRHVLVCGVAALLAGWAVEPRAQGAPRARPATKERVAVKGNLENWSSTRGVRGLERAFEYLSRTDLASLPLGRTDIEGDDVYVMMSEGETKPPEQVKFEAHRHYIDIQLVVRGQESIGVAPVAALTTAEPYDPAKDIEFFAVPREAATLELHAGDFAVFAPGDGHRPSLHLDGPHVSRKAVVKVSVAYRERQRAAASTVTSARRPDNR
jgi:YhcH/YjgK/YiaL family protein